jgi:nitrogen PTS system EIIA component
MKILDYLDERTIVVDLHATDKKGVIDELSLPVAEQMGIDQEIVVAVLMERERYGSTGIGNGIGIPHGKLSGLSRLIVGFGISKKGVNFDTLDGKPAHIFFLLLSPDDSSGSHLSLLARISRLLKDRQFKDNLINSKDAKEVIRIIFEADTDT